MHAISLRLDRGANLPGYDQDRPRTSLLVCVADHVGERGSGKEHHQNISSLDARVFVSALLAFLSAAFGFFSFLFSLSLSLSPYASHSP